MELNGRTRGRIRPKLPLLLITLTFLVSVTCAYYAPTSDSEFEPAEELPPTVMVALLVRNKAYILPWTLRYLELLDYPKNRISLWIRTDHNRDNSSAILQDWMDHVQHEYHHIDFQHDDSSGGYPDQTGWCHWSEQRFLHIIQLRQQAIDAARHAWADYIFMLDADVLLVNPYTLSRLIQQQKTIIAPMLNFTVSEYYSNFWAGTDERGFYLRTEEYIPTMHRHRQGCFPVAMVHTAFLINLRHTRSQLLAYQSVPDGYSAPLDDIILFGHWARAHGIPMHLLNDDLFGYGLVPMEAHNTLEQEMAQFSHTKLETLIWDAPFEKLDYIQVAPPLPDKLGFDQVYMINLLRRPDRRSKMLDCFRELGIDAKIIDAVDGKELNETYLQSMGVKMLDGYVDPFTDRPLTMGEIGCFLSHYIIWQDMVKNGYERIAIFEDDVRFEPYFRYKLMYLMWEIETYAVEWDLIYLGRKRLNAEKESWVAGTNNLVNVEYSYWTISYLLNHSGVVKLLAQEPLNRMIPVDEYLPVMMDKHPNELLNGPFKPRNLIGLSSEPLLVYPTHYRGEEGYITDTEDSYVLDVDSAKGDMDDMEELFSDAQPESKLQSQSIMQQKRDEF